MLNRRTKMFENLTLKYVQCPPKLYSILSTGLKGFLTIAGIHNKFIQQIDPKKFDAILKKKKKETHCNYQNFILQ